jgi:hypothetical protein
MSTEQVTDITYQHPESQILQCVKKANLTVVCALLSPIMAEVLNNIGVPSLKHATSGLREDKTEAENERSKPNEQRKWYCKTTAVTKRTAVQREKHRVMSYEEGIVNQIEPVVLERPTDTDTGILYVL